MHSHSCRTMHAHAVKQCGCRSALHAVCEANAVLGRRAGLLLSVLALQICGHSWGEQDAAATIALTEVAGREGATRWCSHAVHTRPALGLLDHGGAIDIEHGEAVG